MGVNAGLNVSIEAGTSLEALKPRRAVAEAGQDMCSAYSWSVGLFSLGGQPSPTLASRGVPD